MKNILIRLLILLIFSAKTCLAQFSPIHQGLPTYSFIHYELNRFDLVDKNQGFRSLYSKFDTLLSRGTNRITIVHIGGSHIQADIYTHRIRQELQSMSPGILGSRGFFFPYKIARTNSPSNLSISYTGEWATFKNTQPGPTATLGLSGLTSKLLSDTGTIRVVARFDSVRRYDFNSIRVYCNALADSCRPAIYPPNLVKQVTIDDSASYVQYDLNDYTDTLNLIMCRGDSANPFALYGLFLDNDDPGITYNSIGVNGAMLKSYLQCNLFSRQLKSLNPDWIIISIGTNEGNTRNFDEEVYRSEYIKMITTVRNTSPQAALLLTVPNDSYLNKRYINHNTALIRKIIYELAERYGCGVWDFYSIMGGLDSAKMWYNHGLMAKDHIHFNKAGYLLKGELFINAFLTTWNDPVFTTK